MPSQVYQQVFEHGGIGMVLVDRKGQVRVANRAMSEMCGISTEAIRRQEVFDLVSPEHAGSFRTAFQATIRSEQGARVCEFTRTYRDGSEGFVRVRLAVLDKSDSDSLTLVSFTDLTPLREAEMALSQSQTILNAFYNSNSLNMGVVDLLENDIVLVQINRTASASLRSTPEALIGKSASALGVPSHVIDMWSCQFRKSALLGEPVHFTYDDNSAGPPNFTRATVSPIVDPFHQRQLFSFVAERFDSKSVESGDRALSGTTLRDLINEVSVVVWEYDWNEARFIYISGQVEAMFGYPQERWLSEKGFWANTLIHPVDRESSVNLCTVSVENGLDHDFEYRVVTADGRIRWVRDMVRCARDFAGKVTTLRGVFIDITDRKNAELRLLGQRRVFEMLTRGDPLDEVLQAHVEAIQSFGPELAATIHRVEDDSARMSLSVGPDVAPNLIPLISEVEVSPFAGPIGAAAYKLGLLTWRDDDVRREFMTSEFERELRRAGYRQVRAKPIRSAGGRLWGVLTLFIQGSAESEPSLQEFLRSTADMAAIAIERRQSESELVRYRERLEELVEQRTGELIRSQQHLMRAERLASMGTLAAGIAHEINNPVGSMMLAAENIESALQRGMPADEVRPLARQMLDYCQQCARIVRSILQFARGDPTQKWPVQVNEVVMRSIEMSRRLAGKVGAVLNADLYRPSPVVNANPIQIEQVIGNLIRNAIDAIDNDRIPLTITVRTESDGSTVTITVEDTGRGIPEKELEHVRDPFFTTKLTSGGTGLGLSIASGIISEHQGSIRILSRINCGTRVIITLPALPTTVTGD